MEWERDWELEEEGCERYLVNRVWPLKINKAISNNDSIPNGVVYPGS